MWYAVSGYTEALVTVKTVSKIQGGPSLGKKLHLVGPGLMPGIHFIAAVRWLTIPAVSTFDTPAVWNTPRGRGSHGTFEDVRGVGRGWYKPGTRTAFF